MAEKPLAPSPTSKPKRKGTLLFVDDERNILSALRRVFRPLGYQVLVAESGAAGLKLLEQQPVDLVVSDMRMPEMNGAEFLSHVAHGWPQVMRILLTGFTEMEAAIEAVNSGHIYGYYSKPWEEAELRLGVKNALKQKYLTEEKQRLLKRLAARNKELMEMNASLDTRVQVRTAQLQTALSSINNANQELRQQYSDTVRAFSRMIELREGQASGHPRRVAERARRLGEVLGVEGQDLQNIVFAALLLQVGTMTLPDKLLNRPINVLSKLERDAFIHHAVIGASLLKDITPLKEAARLIAPQYECFDGSGKPSGLLGDAIPLGSRILTVVRDYDFLLEGRLTGKVLTASEAQAQLRRLRGKKYDPEVVDGLIELVGEVKDTVYRPTLEASIADLAPGMEIVEVTQGGSVFLRDTVITAPMIKEIEALQKKAGSALTIKIKARK